MAQQSALQRDLNCSLAALSFTRHKSISTQIVARAQHIEGEKSCSFSLPVTYSEQDAIVLI
jgi:hypothetical protein